MKINKKWELLKEVDISPSPWFPLYKHTVKLPNGKIIDDYYLSKLGDVSMVIAITKNREVVFVKQYKHGAGEAIIELPAGRIRKSNTPQKEAVLELEEETGYRAKNIKYIGYVFVEPSKDTLKTHAFLVKDLEIKHSQKLEETEDIEVILIPINEIDKRIKSGEIAASDTIAVIRLTQLKYPDLFK